MSYRKETDSLFNRLVKAGFTILAVNDGMDWEDVTKQDKAVATATNIACSVHEAWVRIYRDGHVFTLYLVYGNSPGELVSDFSWKRDAEDSQAFSDLDSLLDQHYNDWSQYE